MDNNCGINSIKRFRLTCAKIHIMNIGRYLDRLIFIMGNLYLKRQSLYLKTYKMAKWVYILGDLLHHSWRRHARKSFNIPFYRQMWSVLFLLRSLDKQYIARTVEWPQNRDAITPMWCKTDLMWNLSPLSASPTISVSTWTLNYQLIVCNLVTNKLQSTVHRFEHKYHTR